MKVHARLHFVLFSLVRVLSMTDIFWSRSCLSNLFLLLKSSTKRASVRHHPGTQFDPQKDADVLRKAMKGIGMCFHTLFAMYGLRDDKLKQPESEYVE